MPSGLLNLIDVPSPSAYPADNVPETLVTYPSDMRILLIAWLVLSHTSANVPSGESLTSVGPLNRAAVPTASVDPNVLPPANTL